MNKETMQQLILEALSKRLGDGFHITIGQVLKTNVQQEGLVIQQEGENVTPTIYLESFYEDLENGVSMDNVIDSILRSYSTARVGTRKLDTASLLDFTHIRHRLYVELINRHFNKELLQDIPHALFLDDFAITVRCMIDASENGIYNFLIHNNHLKMWQIDTETLISLALHNTRKMLGVDLTPMDDFIQALRPDLVNGNMSASHIWIMTNKRQLAGASTVLFDDVLRDFAKEHGSFFVIFSSVHEALLFPAQDSSDINILTEINQAVNETDVLEDEILGTKAYYYCKDKGFVL